MDNTAIFNWALIVIVLILTIAAIILFAIQLESLPKLDLKQKIEDGFEGFKFEVSLRAHSTYWSANCIFKEYSNRQF